jgi:hypothetical protein
MPFVRRSFIFRYAHRKTVNVPESGDRTDKEEQYGYPSCPQPSVQKNPKRSHTAYGHEKEYCELEHHGQSTDNFAVVTFFHNIRIIS